MKLLTKANLDALMRNGRKTAEAVAAGQERPDHKPVVKFFNPTGAATWLISEIDEDGDTMYGLCDLGMGTPEVGTVSLRELSTVKVRMGLGIERDRWFTGKHPLSAYEAAALSAGHIVEYLS